MTIGIQDLIILGEILLAMVLGGFIGFEREARQKPAGLRTHMLVAGAATFFVVLGQTASLKFSNLLGPDYVRVDAVRIIQAIAVGISFLGAGTIFQRRKGEEVEGLTTAASILFTSAIGIAIGFDQIVLGIGATLIVLVVIEVIGRIESRIWPSHHEP